MTSDFTRYLGTFDYNAGDAGGNEQTANYCEAVSSPNHDPSCREYRDGSDGEEGLASTSREISHEEGHSEEHGSFGGM